MFEDNKQLPVKIPEESLLQGLNYFHLNYHVFQQNKKHCFTTTPATTV